MSDAPTYTCEHDTKAFLGAVHAAVKKFRPAWLRASLLCALSSAFVGMALVVLARAFENQEGYGAAMILLTLAFAFIGCFLVYEYRRVAWERYEKGARGNSWRCTLTNDHYVVESKEGLIVHYPWRTLELQAESPDAWFFKSPSGSLIVYRQPLRDSNLEQLFQAHLNDAKAGAS